MSEDIKFRHQVDEHKASSCPRCHRYLAMHTGREIEECADAYGYSSGAPGGDGGR